MSEELKSWTVNDSSRASNPGNIQANRFRWFLHYPKWPIIWAASSLFFVALAYFVHWSFWIIALLLLAMNWLYWKRIREHFRHGCANPAIVVSLAPMLIAVATDLSKGIGKYPVIKIIEKSLPTVCGQVPQVGSRLATVSLYERSPDDDLPHWADFDPRPVDCVTRDMKAIQTVMNSFTVEDWRELELWLKQVPRPFRCGLYHVRTSE